jgi:hypothetical protein
MRGVAHSILLLARVGQFDQRGPVGPYNATTAKTQRIGPKLVKCTLVVSPRVERKRPVLSRSEASTIAYRGHDPSGQAATECPCCLRTTAYAGSRSQHQHGNAHLSFFRREYTEAALNNPLFLLRSDLASDSPTPPAECRLQDLPISTERLLWNRSVLREKDKALEAMNQRFRDQVFEACWSLIDRFAESNASDHQQV